MLTTWQQTAVTPWKAPFVNPIVVAAAFTSTVAGPLYGYSRKNWYNAPDAGECNLQFMRDVRNPQAITTIEFLGILTQGGSFLVIGWQDRPDITPTSDMPAFTSNVHIIGGATFMEANKYSGLQVNSGFKGAAWQAGSINFTPGQVINFEFV